MKPGRNDPCPCGSGKKYKHCCSNLSQTSAPTQPVSRPPPKEPTANEQNQLIALYKAGKGAELEYQASLLLQRHPESGFCWKILSAALAMQGKSDLPALQRAANLLPKDAQVHNNLGDRLAKREKLHEAESWFRSAIQINPQYADALYNLGQVLSKQRLFHEAERSFRKAIELKSGDPDYHCNLGSILIDQERSIEAESTLRHAIALRPNFPEALNNLGRSLTAQKRYIEAEAYLTQAQKLRPNFPEAYSALASCFKQQLRHSEAEACIRQALELNPNLFEANALLGYELMEQGKFDAAEEHYRLAIAARPDTPGPYYALARAKKIHRNDDIFEALVSIEKKSKMGEIQLSPDELIDMQFGLGKCHEDIGDHDQAFKYYLEACRMKRSTIEYDIQQTYQLFEKIKTIFNQATIDRLHGYGNPSDVPIFIVGMPRSGTTLTEQVIASQPSVHGAGELMDLPCIMQRSIGEYCFPDSLRALDGERLSAWGAEYLCSLRRHAPDAHRISDKLPGNYLAIGLIHLMLPNAKIIHVKRNPVDTCLSCFTMNFIGKNIEYSYDLAELGQYYMAYLDLMEHWRNVLPENAFIEVQYENLISDPEEQARRLIDYCGLEWDPACLDFHKSERSVRTASLAQARKPIYLTSMERWRRYEKHLGPLLDVLGDAVPNR